MADFKDDERPSFPPDLETYNPADWADRGEYWSAKIAFAREHGVYGRTASGKGKILPIMQGMVRQPTGRLQRLDADIDCLDEQIAEAAK